MPTKPSKRFGSKLESKFVQRRYLAVMGQQVSKYDYVYYRGESWRDSFSLHQSVDKLVAGVFPVIFTDGLPELFGVMFGKYRKSKPVTPKTITRDFVHHTLSSPKHNEHYFCNQHRRKTRRVVARELLKYRDGFEDAFVEFDSSKGIARDLW